MAKRKNKPNELLRFYRLLEDVAARLVSAQAEEIDTAVDDCLEKVGRHFHADQVGLGQWSKSGKILPSLRTWGKNPVRDYLVTDGPGTEAFDYFCQKGFLLVYSILTLLKYHHLTS